MKPTVARVKLGRRIRELRHKSGLSQEDLGFKSSLHRTYIGSIERGEQNVSIDNIYKLTKALETSLSELFRPL